MPHRPHAFLFLMRHAKSSWKEASLPDHDRPLKKKGLRQAVAMAEFLKSQRFPLDRIVTSSAVRALQTAELVARTWGLPAPTVDQRLYAASQEVWQQVLTEMPRRGGVLLVGHNPELEELLFSICDEPVLMPPASIACLRIRRDILFPTREGLELAHVWRWKEI
ncbi:SixA phosphatase family protein [Planctomicrobium sp. SH664]|uniref:SixA phosphatase family protein n=1 Tax=Planctomicrobium sp. SH664 TaxID=3448125 RepID=UPI003F5B52E5